jgi:hypothetical protein
MFFVLTTTLWTFGACSWIRTALLTWRSPSRTRLYTRTAPFCTPDVRCSEKRSVTCCLFVCCFMDCVCLTGGRRRTVSRAVAGISPPHRKSACARLFVRSVLRLYDVHLHGLPPVLRQVRTKRNRKSCLCEISIAQR